MKRLSLFGFFLALLVVSSCASFRAAGEIQAGRTALFKDEPAIAVVHFRRAAEVDPNYLMNFGVYSQGVWGYVGRTEYLTGDIPQARRSLERAVIHYNDDYLARLYLGLTLARDGDQPKGLGELQSGMKSIHDWLDHIEYNTPWGRFWDPDKKIRSEIEKSLAMISARQVNWEQLTASGEWIGRTMEREIDEARRDEIYEHNNDNSDDGGDPVS
jgi:tetratricopeptide (TPR) repeat protein